MSSWGDILSLIPKYREERELMKQVGVEGTDNDAMSSKKNSQYGIHFFRTNADYMRYLAEELNTPVGSKAVLPKNVRSIILYIPKIIHVNYAPLWTVQNISNTQVIPCTTRRSRRHIF